MVFLKTDAFISKCSKKIILKKPLNKEFVKVWNYVFTPERCFWVLSRAWDKEKVLIPHEESNLIPLDSTPRCYGFALRCSSTETLWASYRPLLCSFLICVLRTVRISNAESFVGLRFDSSWGLRITFSISHAHEKTKEHLSMPLLTGRPRSN